MKYTEEEFRTLCYQDAFHTFASLPSIFFGTGPTGYMSFFAVNPNTAPAQIPFLHGVN